MKLQLEVKRDGSMFATLDGKTVEVKESIGGASVDFNSIPENTAGKIILEEVWEIANRLRKCDEICEGDVWRELDEELLDEVWEEVNF